MARAFLSPQEARILRLVRTEIEPIMLEMFNVIEVAALDGFTDATYTCPLAVSNMQHWDQLISTMSAVGYKIKVTYGTEVSVKFDFA